MFGRISKLISRSGRHSLNIEQRSVPSKVHSIDRTSKPDSDSGLSSAMVTTMILSQVANHDSTSYSAISTDTHSSVSDGGGSSDCGASSDC